MGEVVGRWVGHDSLGLGWGRFDCLRRDAGFERGWMRNLRYIRGRRLLFVVVRR